jgi:hypothetical protein
MKIQMITIIALFIGTASFKTTGNSILDETGEWKNNLCIKGNSKDHFKHNKCSGF